MAVVLLALGSRGDLTPMLALARALRARGESVRVVALREYAPLVEAGGVEFVPVDADLADVVWHPNPWVRRALIAQPGLMVAQMTARLRRAAPLVVDAVLRASAPGDVVVAGLATASLAASVPDRRAVLALFAPVLPSRDPAATVLTTGLPGWPTTFTSTWGWMLSVEMSGRAGRLARARMPGDDIRPPAAWPARWPASWPGPWPTSWPGPWGMPAAAVAAGRLPILLAADPVLAPPAPDRPAGVRQTGFWTHPADATAPTAPPPGDGGRLESFLAAGTAPVYVGFGSCPAADPAADQRMFVAAARRAGVRLVLQPPPDAAPEAGDDVLLLGEYPHELLFPRMAAVVHHGGAGTTAAAIRAGVPSGVVPHLGDQGYWGRRVVALGAGPRPVPRARLTTGRLARLLREVTGPDAPGMRRTARHLASQLRTDGAERAAEAILGLR